MCTSTRPLKLLNAILVLPTFALCASLPNLVNTNTIVQGSVIPTDLSYSANTSVVYTNTSINNALRLRCDPVRYGRRLRVESCRNVFNFMNMDDTQITFADRSSVQPHDLNLPFRTTDNGGRCYVQPILAQGVVTGRATPREVVGAAQNLFDECVKKYGTGGVAENIGGDNKVNVIIAKYKPDIRCNSSPTPPLDSCINIFSNMYVDKNRQTYGRVPDPRVQVPLPITYTSADRRCTVKVDIKGEPTGLSLYEVWEAIVAVTSTCVRARQKCGKAADLGLGRNIFLQLSDEHPSAQTQPSLAGSWNHSLFPTDENTSM